MSLIELSDKILKCDMDEPYVFISYCSADSEKVWCDVCYLQKLGYNIWIDQNLKETDDSWKTALQALEDIECKLLVFYISRNSIVSSPCLEELQHRGSKEARNTHNGNEIPWIAIEVEPIDDINNFRDRIYENITESSELTRDKKNEMARTLSILMDSFFPNNEKIRIKSKEDSSRRNDYYEKIEENFSNANVTKFSTEKMFEKAMNMFSTRTQYRNAVEIIKRYATEINYLPAILMMAFIYSKGIGVEKSESDANDQLVWATFQLDETKWMEMGFEYKRKGQYADAVAYFLGFAVKNNSEKGYLESCRMWMKMKNASYELAKICAKYAGETGSEEGKKLFDGLRRMSEEKFRAFVKNNN